MGIAVTMTDSVTCPHGLTWPDCPWGCTIGRPEDARRRRGVPPQWRTIYLNLAGIGGDAEENRRPQWKDPFEYENIRRRRKWLPAKVPDLDAAVEERDLVVKLRQARQQLWNLVAAWEVRPELREAAVALTEVLESYDE